MTSLKGGCCIKRCIVLLQMGGPEGVRAAEHLSITMSCDKGMKMHVSPRV